MTSDPTATVAMIFSTLALTLNAATFLRGSQPRRKKTKPQAELTYAMCPCSHGVNYHEELTGRCHFTLAEPILYDHIGRAIKYQEMPCDCQVYAGPELIRGLAALPPLPSPLKDDM